jgi:hypothetical protein
MYQLVKKHRYDKQQKKVNNVIGFIQYGFNIYPME